MTIAETSLLANAEIQPQIGYRQHLVLAELTRRPYQTDKELSRHLSMEINTITPRRKELQKLGKIYMSGERACKITGRRAMTWAPVTNQPTLL